MAFNISVTQARIQGTSVQGVSKATVVYSLVSSLGELTLNRRPVAASLELTPGDPIPDAQSLANFVAGDCISKFGGAPDTVLLQGATLTPVLG